MTLAHPPSRQARERMHPIPTDRPPACTAAAPKESDVLMEPTRTILLAAEDPVTRSFLADNLTADGYTLRVAEDRASALSALESEPPDLAICDVNGETLGLLDAVRNADGLASRIDPETPLIVLTARADELSRLRYYDRGSDDVIAKPFSYPVLRARVRVLLHRVYDRPTMGRLRIGPLTIDPARREVRRGGTPVTLTSVELSLLRHLASDPERVFTKHELLRDVWGFRSPGATRTLDTHACNLRRKLGPGFVANVWGVGYRLLATPATRPDQSSPGDPAA
jgi:DNA-binding response OmpR family regulator